MKGRTLLRQVFLALTVLSSTPAVDAHSWVEQLQRLAANGTMIEPVGYQRGYVSRDNTLFKGDISDDLWQIPINARGDGVIHASDPMCSPQQTGSNYTTDFPKLVTSPGDYLALQHQENGHVTIPGNQKNKPRNRGTIFIYGTEQPKANDTLLAIHNVWNVNGTGGDGRGRLLATRNFDDGQCYQSNSEAIAQSRKAQFPIKTPTTPMGSELWCQSDFQLPTDITTGTDYTLYWVWDWSTLNKANAMLGEEGVKVAAPEIYTSCIDMTIVDPCSEDLGDVKSPACSKVNTKSNFAKSYAKDQAINGAAVAQELTGNFAVPMDNVNADSGSNNGMSAPPNLATGGAATATSGAANTPAASTFQTVTTPAGTGAGAGGGEKTVTALSTVTVTQGIKTVTVAASSSMSTATIVEVATEGSNGQVGVPATASATGSGERPQVTSFLKRRRSRIETFN